MKKKKAAEELRGHSWKQYWKKVKTRTRNKYATYEGAEDKES